MSVDEKKLKELVGRVVDELRGAADDGFQKSRDPASGIMAVRTGTVKPGRFDTGKPGDQVYLKDVLTLQESPRLGCGVMEMRASAFDWTLNYDEVDYVIEGTLEIMAQGRKTVGQQGDIILIPKGSGITFSAPNFARFMYVTYPANWDEQ